MLKKQAEKQSEKQADEQVLSQNSRLMQPAIAPTAITSALKEWSVAIDALTEGKTILLLRKGGIKEKGGQFAAEANRVVLFPTFEHQKTELLKPEYRASVRPVAAGWHPHSITLRAWADITNIFLTDDAEKVAELSRFHIWQADLPQSRLKWKPKQPLYALTLRVFQFAQPISVPWDTAYGGCRSWITLPYALKAAIATEGSEAVIAPDAYQEQVNAIAQILTN